MAEHIKDPEDRLLEALFAAEPIPDDGFSERVVGQLRRRQRVRRWCFGTALALGGAIALKPVLSLAAFVVELSKEIPGGLAGLTTSAIPSTTMLVAGGLLFVLAFIGLTLFED